MAENLYEILKEKRIKMRKSIGEEEFKEYLKNMPPLESGRPVRIQNFEFKGISFSQLTNNLDYNPSVVFDNCSFDNCTIRRVSLESISFLDCDINTLCIMWSNISNLFINGSNNINKFIIMHTICENFWQDKSGF